MKQFLTTDIGTYAFNAAAKTITFSGITLSLKQILAVVNTTRNVIIYNPIKATLGGTFAANVLTLTFDTTTHSNTDQLMIVIDAPAPLIKITDGTNIAAVKPASTSVAAADPALVVGISPNTLVLTNQQLLNGNTIQGGAGVVNTGVQRTVLATDQPALTNSQPIRQRWDNSRDEWSWDANLQPTVATATMWSIAAIKNGVAQTAGTSFVIPSGKILRLTSLQMEVIALGSGTARQSFELFLYYNATGAATTASVPIKHWRVDSPAVAVVGGNNTMTVIFPDGLELPIGDGTKQFGFAYWTGAYVITTATVYILMSAHGVAYTPA